LIFFLSRTMELLNYQMVSLPERTYNRKFNRYASIIPPLKGEKEQKTNQVEIQIQFEEKLK
jgi:hypothetical protein